MPLIYRCNGIFSPAQIEITIILIIRTINVFLLAMTKRVSHFDNPHRSIIFVILLVDMGDAFALG